MLFSEASLSYLNAPLYLNLRASLFKTTLSTGDLRHFWCICFIYQYTGTAQREAQKHFQGRSAKPPHQVEILNPQNASANLQQGLFAPLSPSVQTALLFNTVYCLQLVGVPPVSDNCLTRAIKANKGDIYNCWEVLPFFWSCRMGLSNSSLWQPWVGHQ